MQLGTPAFIGLLACFALAAARSAQGGGKTDPAHAPISLQELAARGVAGPLGPRLGTLVEIAGVVVPNTSRAKADVDLPFLLRVDSVDGRPLTESVIYPYVRAGAGLTLAAPALGDSFHYAGYETGGFDGTPAGEARYVPPHADRGYGFLTYFVVLAVKRAG